MNGKKRSEIDPVTRARIAAWLRYYRDRRGWTDTKLAEKLDVAQPTVTNIMNGKRTPGLDIVIKAHRMLHVSADDLIDEDPPEIKD